MPTYQFEAIDASTGKEIRDVVDAPTEAEAQATIRSQGYMITKIKVQKQAAAAGGSGKKKPGRSFAIGGVKSRDLTLFTRQLSILTDAGLPILRSLRILAEQAEKGRLKNSLLDTCDEIEGGSTLSEAMSKSPKCFNRLYVNMIRAGEAGGALEVILRRLSEFMERSQSLKRKVKGAMVYPIVVVSVAVGILTFIMIKIVPQFKKIFDDFGTTLPPMTEWLIWISNAAVNYWYLIPAIPFGFNLIVKGIKMTKYGRFGWDLFTLKVVIFGQLVEKNICSRSTRTLGTLLASGVPILEALNITKETSGNMMFEQLFSKVSDSIRDGESIAKPLKEFSVPPFNLVALLFWAVFLPGVGALLYLTKYKKRVVDDLVVNMVDVGEESGELDTMLYKVADTYDEEVAVLTESLTSLMEPLLIIFLGGAVGFIVIALFMPLIKLITDLS
ncbi:MAG: type II secretion system F family protein [Planctomycetota bacterium]|nr:type II secretion system F family protein [Planctomycetia bacterium]RLS31498.1 MAG: type II secretion system F family protein [Planctomycetota bacterium]RLT00110.1 MAG: type II secretion system F family protein [Planctomycetota bacterium]